MNTIRRNSNAMAALVGARSRRNSTAPELHSIFSVDQIAIDVLWGADRSAGATILLQGFECDSLDKARGRLNFLLQHMRCVRTLTINLETSRLQEIEVLIETLLDAENVRLEVLNVRRRYVGQRCELLADLVAANAESLRVVSKLGLSEIDGLSERTRLERLSLMNFDLVDPSESELESPLLAERTRHYLRRLAVSGATFAHLSYTTYSGFDIAANPALYMLRQCGVTSLRLTMQKGSPIGASPFGPSPVLLPALQRLELVGLMAAPRERLSALFPALEFYNVETDEFDALDAEGERSNCASSTSSSAASEAGDSRKSSPTTSFSEGSYVRPPALDILRAAAANAAQLCSS